MTRIEMKDYKITVKIRNNRILNAIQESGGTPGQKWCAENGLNYSKVNSLINMTISPITKSGRLHAEAEKLCDVLNKLPEELWSKEQIYPLEKNFTEMEMSYEQIVALLPDDQNSYLPDYSNLEREQTKALISSALETLSNSEREIIRMRFEDDLTYAECGKLLNISTTRAMQIEAKALRKLRKPHIVMMYMDALDFDDDRRNLIKKLAEEYLERGKY